MQMYRHTFGDDFVSTLLVILIVYLLIAAPLGLPGGELVLAIRSMIESLLHP